MSSLSTKEQHLYSTHNPYDERSKLGDWSVRLLLKKVALAFYLALRRDLNRRQVTVTHHGPSAAALERMPWKYLVNLPIFTEETDKPDSGWSEMTLITS